MLKKLKLNGSMKTSKTFKHFHSWVALTPFPVLSSHLGVVATEVDGAE